MLPLWGSRPAGPPWLMRAAWAIFAVNLVLPAFLPSGSGLSSWFRLFATASLWPPLWYALRLIRARENPRVLWDLWAAFFGFLLAVRGVFFLFPEVKAALPHLPWGQTHHLVSYGIEILAFIAWGTAREERGHTGWNLLEDLLFALGAFFLVWMLGLRAFVVDVSLPRLETGMLIGIVLFTALLLGMWGSLFLRPPPGDRRRLAWIGLGLTYSVGRNALLSFAHHEGQAWLLMEAQALDPLTWLCFGQAFATPRGAEAEDHRYGTRFQRLLPYVPAMLSLVLVWILLFVEPRRLDWQVVLLLTPMIVLLLWRQSLVMGETRATAQSLELLVEERTRSLAEAQSLLLKTERMNTMASIGAGMAHDLNNLIGASLLCAEKMELELAEGGAPEARDLDRLKEATRRAGELTAQLMAFGRPQALPIQAFDLGGHLRDKQNLFKAVVPSHISFIVETGPKPIPVLLDPSQIDQILVNLISNAVDATRAGGRIWVRTRKEGDQALLEVQDEGVGIPEQVLDRIFQPFFTTKAPGRGTGLGLASVKALVDQFAGTTNVESTVGRGTTFRIQFPLERGDAGEVA
ncbi:MAG: histidine kinase [Holophagaceae bacterium]|nr:histidine kinase [Holophagaceae bacterium]